MAELWLVLRIHAWFWLVAALSILAQRAPMYLVVIIAALAMYWAGYCVVWSARDNADLHKD